MATLAEKLTPELKRKLRGLTDGEYRVLRVIIDFVKWKYGRTGDPVKARCFTYDSILKHASYTRTNIPSLTIDRNIRKLRELGLIQTFKRSGRTVFHCLHRDLAEAAIDEYRDEYEQ